MSPITTRSGRPALAGLPETKWAALAGELDQHLRRVGRPADAAEPARTASTASERQLKPRRARRVDLTPRTGENSEWIS